MLFLYCLDGIVMKLNHLSRCLFGLLSAKIWFLREELHCSFAMEFLMFLSDPLEEAIELRERHNLRPKLPKQKRSNLFLRITIVCRLEHLFGK